MIVLFLIFVLLAFFTLPILKLFFSGSSDAQYLADKAKIVLLLRSIFSLIALIILVFSTLVIVNAGHVGVITRFGAVQRSVNPGLNVKVPFVEGVKIVDTRVQKVETEADAASKDLQT